MRLSTSLIAVKRITSSVPCSDFIDIEQSAQLILDAEGVINPIVVRRTSLYFYEGFAIGTYNKLQKIYTID